MTKVIEAGNAVKIGIISDLHYPFESAMHVSNACEVLRKENPDIIVVDGDLLDAYEASKYERNPSVMFLLKDEIPMGFTFLSALREDHPNAKIILVEGNHEFRIKAYMMRNAPMLYDPEFLPKQLKLESLGIEWIGTRGDVAKWTDTYFDFEGIHIGHFDRVNQGAGQTVRQLMIKKGGSFIQAHVHRAAIIYFTDISGNLSFGMETPCLAKPPNYGSMTDWARGLSFLDKDEQGWRPRLIVFNN